VGWSAIGARPSDCLDRLAFVLLQRGFDAGCILAGYWRGQVLLEPLPESVEFGKARAAGGCVGGTDFAGGCCYFLAESKGD
jgi:hypothetical protein